MESSVRMIPIGKIKNLEPLPWLGALLADERLRGRDGAQGPCGVSGLNGADGQDGVDGRDGAPGRDGIDGRDGRDGERGPQGLQGERGYDGERGEQGEPGERGLQGEIGPRGPRGPKGDKGDPGNPPRHEVDQKKHRIRFERPDGTMGAWFTPLQQTIHEVHGGGSGFSPLIQQDIDFLKAGKFPEYSRVTVVTASVSLTDFHRIVVAKTNTLTVTLPAAAKYYNATYGTGIIYTIKNDKANANNITVQADGAELIDNANTLTVPPGAAPKICTDGVKWEII